jgi:preprotein translocase subunit YajC
MHTLALLFAASAPNSGSGGSGSIVQTLIMFGGIIVVFYFMILRPQQKRQAAQRKLLESVKKGDKVVMTGGMHGTVAGVDDTTVLVEIGTGVKVKFEKGSVQTITSGGE